MTNLNTREIRTLALFMAALPGTYKEIMVKSGLSVCTVQKWASRMRTEGEIHVSGWHRAQAQGLPCPVLVMGPGKDAEAPAPVVGLSKSSRRRAKVREAIRASPQRQESTVSYAMRSQPALARVWA